MRTPSLVMTTILGLALAAGGGIGLEGLRTAAAATPTSPDGKKKGTDAGAAAEPSKKDLASARKAAGEAVVAYKAGWFDVAIAAWKKAYGLVGKDSYLFNIAKAYERKGEKLEAAEFYAEYVRVSRDEKRRAVAEKKLLGLGGAPDSAETTSREEDTAPAGADILAPGGDDGDVATRPAASDGEGDDGSDAVDAGPAASSGAAATPLAGIPDTTLADADGGGAHFSASPFVTGGIGVVGIGLGVVFGQLARSRARELERLACSTPGDPSCAAFGGSEGEAFAVYETGKTFNTLQIVGYTAGGTLLLTGIVLLAVEASRSDDASVRAGPGVTATVSPVLGPDTFGASARVTF